MLLTMALDVLGAFLVTRLLLKWWTWVPAAFFVGAALSVAVALATAALGYALPGRAFISGLGAAPLHGLITCFAAWFFAGRAQRQ